MQLVVPGLQIDLLLPSFEYLQFSNEWYRLFTVALTHANLLHLGFNMYALMVLGNPLEAAFGKNKFLIVFFVSLLSGSLASAYFAPILGTSVGAISGVAALGLLAAGLFISRPASDSAGLALENIRKIDPQQKTVALLHDTFSIAMRRFTSAQAIGPGITALRKRPHLIHDPRNLFVWTVDDADDMRFCADNGVDVLITNTPSYARSVLGYN